MIVYLTFEYLKHLTLKMKKLLIFTLLLSSALTTFSQSTYNKSSAFIGLGPSIPIGDFSSKNAAVKKQALLL
jgi:hypothetical protein